MAEGQSSRKYGLPHPIHQYPRDGPRWHGTTRSWSRCSPGARVRLWERGCVVERESTAPLPCRYPWSFGARTAKSFDWVFDYCFPTSTTWPRRGSRVCAVTTPWVVTRRVCVWGLGSIVIGTVQLCHVQPKRKNFQLVGVLGNVKDVRKASSVEFCNPAKRNTFSPGWGILGRRWNSAKYETMFCMDRTARLSTIHRPRLESYFPTRRYIYFKK